MKKAVLVAVTLCFCPAAFAASVITTRLDDPKAIYVDPPATNADSSAALQAAIDKASGTGREGIVFVPAGRYTITRTVYSLAGRAAHRIWRHAPGVRASAEYARLPEGYGRDGDVHGPHTSRAVCGPEIALRFLLQDRYRRTTTWPMPIRIRSIRR